MDRAENKRPSRGYKNYNKLNKTITIKNYLEAYFAKGYVIKAYNTRFYIY
jgi:hypothetical protein